MNLLYTTLFALCAVTRTLAIFKAGEAGFLSATGDFNNDKHVDVVVVNKDAKQYLLRILYAGGLSSGSGKPENFEQQGSDLVVGDKTILSVVPGDFNADSTLDILVFFQGAEPDEVLFGVFWHDKTSRTDYSSFDVISSFKFTGQPLICDVDGNQVPDMLGQIGEEFVVLSTDFDSSYLKGNFDNSFKKRPFSAFSSGGNPNPLNPKIAHMFAQAVDSRFPDIILGTINEAKVPIFEIWSIDTSKGHYRHVPDKDCALPGPFTGQPVVTDIDLDGQNDIVIPVCDDEACKDSRIFYKSLLSGCTWYLLHSFPQSASARSYATRRFNSKSDFSNLNNVMLRVGDINYDGYPDFLATLQVDNENDKNKPSTTDLYLLMNTECREGNDNVCNSSRGLDVSDMGIRDVQIATFFDFREDGNNDVIYSKKRSDGSEGFILGSNEVSQKGDDAFLKVYVIGGLCGSETYPCHFDTINYGANLPGPTLYYNTIGTKGRRRVAVGSQLSQATHFALQTPYVIFGLGQIPNFVEQLFINLAYTNTTDAVASLEAVIPNSQLILIPHPPNDSSEWAFQLLLTPSSILWKFATALLVVAVTISIFVGLLEWQEKRENDREKREEAHKFHFDAL